MRGVSLVALGVWLSGQPALTAELATRDGPTFARDIAPIVHAHCATCHRADGDAPFALTSFDDVRQRASLIRDVTRRRYMPPWKPEPGFGDFHGTRRLGDDQIALIEQWVESGAPHGSPVDLPPAPRWPSRWPLGPPDIVLQLPAYELRAGGADVFRNFVVPASGTGMRYVRGVQFRPGTPAVHHANIRVDRTVASRRLDDADPEPGYEGLILRSADFPDGHFLGWTPGQVMPVLSDALAWRLDANADFVVQLHLRPTGKTETVAPVIALYFGSGPPARTPTVIRLGRQDLDIPAGASTSRVTDSFVLPVDVELHAVQPHAHYRARDVHAWATLPDGSKRPILRIRDWDMNWQDRYQYAAPFWLPAASTITLEYSFDNSMANPRNPDRPLQRVGWGWRSADEMADLWMQVMTRSESDRVTLNRVARTKMQTEDIKGGERLLQQEPDHVALRNDVAMIYMALGRPEQAVTHFEAVTQLQPGSAAAWYNEGVALEAMGDWTRAAERYTQAIGIDGSYSAAHNNLGSLLLREGRLDGARREYELAIRADPLNAEAHANLGMVMLAERQPDAALAHVREALRLQPARLIHVTPFVWLLATHPEPAARRPRDARALADQIVSETGRRDLSALDALAAAHAALGQFDEAVRVASEALAAASEPAHTTMREAIRQRIAGYREGRAFTLPR